MASEYHVGPKGPSRLAPYFPLQIQRRIALIPTNNQFTTLGGSVWNCIIVLPSSCRWRIECDFLFNGGVLYVLLNDKEEENSL